MPLLSSLRQPFHLRDLLKNIRVEFSPNPLALSKSSQDKVNRSLLGELGLADFHRKYWQRIYTGDAGTRHTSRHSELNLLKFKVISNTSAAALPKAVLRSRLRRRWNAAIREAVRLSLANKANLKLHGNLEVQITNGFGLDEPMEELVAASGAILEIVADQLRKDKSRGQKAKGPFPPTRRT